MSDLFALFVSSYVMGHSHRFLVLFAMAFLPQKLNDLIVESLIHAQMKSTDTPRFIYRPSDLHQLYLVKVTCCQVQMLQTCVLLDKVNYVLQRSLSDLSRLFYYKITGKADLPYILACLYGFKEVGPC